MAPEIIEMTGQQSSACDIWSVGCTVVELLTGKPPYFDLDQMPALFRIVQDDHPPLPEGISGVRCLHAVARARLRECAHDPARQPLEEFLFRCFNKDPLNRPSAEELLRHPWLRDARNLRAKEIEVRRQPR